MWAQLCTVQSKPLWKAVLGKMRGSERGWISESSSDFLVVVHLCPTLWIPRTRLPCRAWLAEFNPIARRRLWSGCRLGFFPSSSWPAAAPWEGVGHWPLVFDSPVALGRGQDAAVSPALLYGEEWREGWVAGQHLTSEACTFCCPLLIQGLCFLQRSCRLTRHEYLRGDSDGGQQKGHCILKLPPHYISDKITHSKMSSRADSLHSSLENVIWSLWNVISHLPFLPKNWST